MEDMANGHGTSEEEIFEELKIRHDIEPIGSMEEYMESLDEIVQEKLEFGELHPDDDIESLKSALTRRFDEFKNLCGITLESEKNFGDAMGTNNEETADEIADELWNLIC